MLRYVILGPIRDLQLALKEMSLDILFKERGFEFYWEHQRRTDMIRFGKYEGT